MVSTGQIARLETTTGKDGKSRKRPTPPDKAVAVPVTADTICETNPKVKTKVSQQLATRWVEKANAAVEALTELKELQFQGDLIEARAFNVQCALDIAEQAAALGLSLLAESSTVTCAAATNIEAPAEPRGNGHDAAPAPEVGPVDCRQPLGAQAMTARKRRERSKRKGTPPQLPGQSPEQELPSRPREPAPGTKLLGKRMNTSENEARN